MGQFFIVGRGLCAAGVLPLVALSIGLSGCALETSDGGEAEDVGSQHEELSVSGGGEVGYYSLLNSQNLGTTFNNTCFLTEIGGSFQGGGEWVKVEQSGGNWILSYGSQQGGNINAAAKCFYRPMTATKTWNKGGNPVFLQNGGFCALQRVMGKLAGGGEEVKVYKDANQNWYVTGSSQTNQALSATAGCISLESNVVRTNWASSKWDMFLLSDTSPSKKACVLQGVKGAFTSINEQLWVTYGPDQYGNPFWNMHGQSKSAAGSLMVGGTAGCVAGSNQPLP